MAVLFFLSVYRIENAMEKKISIIHCCDSVWKRALTHISELDWSVYQQPVTNTDATTTTHSFFARCYYTTWCRALLLLFHFRRCSFFFVGIRMCALFFVASIDTNVFVIGISRDVWAQFRNIRYKSKINWKHMKR